MLRAQNRDSRRVVPGRRPSRSLGSVTRIGRILLLTGLTVGNGTAAQEPTFAPGRGPVVLMDMGHNNGVLRGEPYLSPVGRLQDDGYQVRTLTGTFTAASLAGVDMVVIIAPLADRNRIGRVAECAPPRDYRDPECQAAMDARIAEAWRRPTPSAYSEDELDALEGWVRRGGGLFLVVDIFPFPGAIESLAGRFGIEISNGFAVDESRLPELPQPEPPLLGDAGELVFRRADQTLAEHPVTNGRRPAERVDAIASIAGSAFRLPPDAQSLLTFGPSSVSLLPEVSWVFSEATPRQPIAGWSQGGLLRVRDGRIAIFGESGILQPHGPRFDERYPGVQNAELVRNVFHWLSGLLDEP